MRWHSDRGMLMPTSEAAASRASRYSASVSKRTPSRSNTIACGVAGKRTMPAPETAVPDANARFVPKIARFFAPRHSPDGHMDSANVCLHASRRRRFTDVPALSSPSMKKRRMLVRGMAAVLAALLVFVSGAWGALAMAYRFPGPRYLRIAAAAVWALGCVALWVAWLGFDEPRALAGLVVAFGALLAWWATIRPRNDRVWADDVARLLHGEVEGSRVRLHNVRDFDWRGEDDYDVHWETREYDLDRLRGADAILSYWSGEAIAHAMLSFGFDDGRHVVFSVEIRRKRGEAFSEIGGFFRQFELVLIAADERDIVRVRTNVRGEDDYLFPLRMTRDAMRSLFVSYVEAANALARTPRFYNTVTSNCTTIVYRMAKRIDGGLPFDPRLLLTGYLPEYFMDNGALDGRFSLDEWRRSGRITERARASRPGEDFSAAIRVGVPPAQSPASGDSTA